MCEQDSSCFEVNCTNYLQYGLKEHGNINTSKYFMNTTYNNNDTNSSNMKSTVETMLDTNSSSATTAAGTTTTSSTSLQSSSSIGVNLRVTGQCSQGGRKYMEDYFSVAYQQSENAKDLEYAFVGIYDGHGGAEAATFAKEHLMMEIINQKLFWSDSDQDVLRAIREGYIATHYAMWRDQGGFIVPIVFILIFDVEQKVSNISIFLFTWALVHFPFGIFHIYFLYFNVICFLLCEFR